MKNEQELQSPNTPLAYFLPVIFIIAIIPLITYGKIIELSPEEADFWKGGAIQVDFFSYYKSTCFIIAACASLLSYAHIFLKQRLPFQNDKRYIVPMTVYVLFVILSTVFSPYRNVALLGFMDIFQGMSVLLSYILVTFIVMNLLNSERDIKIIINSVIFLTAAVGILGLSQYFGHDLLQTDIGRKLITPEILEDANLKFTFGKYTIYATMYNTNFVGSFSALVLPITVFLFLGAEDKKKEIIHLIITILAYTTWIGCNSRAGYLRIITAVIAAIIFFNKLIKGKYKKIILLIIVYLIISIIFNLVSGGRVLGQFTRLSPLTEAEKLKKVQEEQKVRFEEISVKDNTFTIKTTTEELTGIFENNELKFIDNNNQLHTTIDESNKITFTDKKYSEYNIEKAENFPFIKLSVYKRPLNLYITEDNTIKVISMNYKLTEPVAAPRIRLFDGKETFASNRGYIWSRTIPMLKDTIIIGYGPDNYCLMFPQEDYVGRFNTGVGMTNIVVDKPHNMYMQTAVNTGVISLISLIIIWTVYLLDCIKLFNKREINSFSEYMGAAVFLSITAYLAAGMFNDSIISVAPLFWVILGLGISINKMIKIDNFHNQC